MDNIYFIKNGEVEITKRIEINAPIKRLKDEKYVEGSHVDYQKFKQS